VPIIEDLRTRLSDTLQQMTALTESEERSDTTDSNLKDLEAEAISTRARIDEIVRVQELRASAGDLDTRLRRAEQSKSDPASVEMRTAESWGDMFTRSQDFQSYPGRGTGTKVTVGDPLHQRAVIKTTTFPSLFEPVRVPDVPLLHSTPLLDVLGRVTVGSGSIEYVRRSGAAPVAGKVAEGATKPEATLALSVVPATLEMLAHYVIATRQALEDSTQLRDIINSELTQGVLDKMEAEAALAVTTDGDLPTAVEGADLVSAIRLGIGAVSGAGGRANTVLIHPDDYAALDLEVMGLAQLLPSLNTSPWGVTYVPAGALTPGSPFVLDSRAARVYQRTSGVQMYVTDSGAPGAVDLFTHNLFAILAEIRQKTVVLRPEFVQPVTVAVTP
jgi:HK97 family phage major capsid protein